MSNEEEENFREWLKDLPVSTITDELIKSILIRLDGVLDEAYENGVNAAKKEMKEFLEGRM
jgi:hypothetical protein